MERETVCLWQINTTATGGFQQAEQTKLVTGIVEIQYNNHAVVEDELHPRSKLVVVVVTPTEASFSKATGLLCWNMNIDISTRTILCIFTIFRIIRDKPNYLDYYLSPGRKYLSMSSYNDTVAFLFGHKSKCLQHSHCWMTLNDLWMLHYENDTLEWKPIHNNSKARNYLQP